MTSVQSTNVDPTRRGFSDPEHPDNKANKWRSRFEFDEYGVNNRYESKREVFNECAEDSKMTQEYINRRLEISLKEREVKEEGKALDREFKERGFQVAKVKRVWKKFIALSQMTQEDQEHEEIIMSWIAADPEITRKLSLLHEITEEAKQAWKANQEERFKKYDEHMTSIMKERRVRQDALGYNWLDFERDRLAKLVSTGVHAVRDQLEKLEAMIKDRDERKAKGLPDLPEHYPPSYPDEWMEHRKKEIQAQEDAARAEAAKHPKPSKEAKEARLKAKEAAQFIVDDNHENPDMWKSSNELELEDSLQTLAHMDEETQETNIEEVEESQESKTNISEDQETQEGQETEEVEVVEDPKL